MRYIAYILFLFLSILGYGQVTILSEAEGKEYQVREPFNLSIGLQIVGESYQQQSPVRLPDLSKFDILGNATETYETIDPITGNLVRQAVHHFILQPKQSGKIKIGSAQVQVNGRVYKSEPFDILVKENLRRNLENENARMSLTMEVLDKETYENQPVRVVLKLKTESNNFDNFRRVNHLKLPQNTKNIHPVNLKRQDIEVEKGDEVSQIIASFVVIPDKGGNMVISPAMAEYNNDKILSNSLKLNVKNLPSGAPANFKNAVGKFDIKIEIPQEEVEINQPLDVFVKLIGTGNLDKIKLPKIKQSADYTLFKPKQKVDFTPRENGLSGEITEHYVIIPKKEGDITIHSEDFAYFDTDKEKYQNIVTQQFRIVSLSKEEYNEKKSTIDKVADGNTEQHILKRVNLQTIDVVNETAENSNIGYVIGIGLLIGGALLGLHALVFRKKTKNIVERIPEKITNIAETEEMLKNQISIGKEYYFRSLKKDLDRQDYSRFFETYEELHSDVEKQLQQYENQSISQFLLEKTNDDFVKEYDSFRERINAEKYAPVHQNLYEFYNDIVKFYSKIMK